MTDDQKLLAQMRVAYNELIAGRAARVVQKDGRRVEYTPASASLLSKEIQRIEANLRTGFRRPPARVY